MPTKSAKQERFMQAVAHNPAFAKKAGVSQSVGKEFTKGPKKFSAGGSTDPKQPPKNPNDPKDQQPPKQGFVDRMINKFLPPSTYGLKDLVEKAGSSPPPEKKAKGGPVKESKEMTGKEVAFMKKQGAPKSMIKHEQAEMENMKPSRVKKYARGGGIESRGKTRGKMC